MANVAVIWVLLTTDVALTVIPVPLKLIVAPVAKPDPVSVTGTLVPWAPLFALIELSVSVVTAACSRPHPAGNTKTPNRNAINRFRDRILPSWKFHI
jgi:hypothetical protein